MLKVPTMFITSDEADDSNPIVLLDSLTKYSLLVVVA